MNFRLYVFTLTVLIINSSYLVARESIYPDTFYRDFYGARYGGTHTYEISNLYDFKQVPLYDNVALTNKVGEISIRYISENEDQHVDEIPLSDRIGYVKYKGDTVCIKARPQKILPLKAVSKYAGVHYNKKGIGVFQCPLLHLENTYNNGRTIIRFNEEHKDSLEIITDFGERIFIPKKDITFNTNSYELKKSNKQIRIDAKVSKQENQALKKALDIFKKDLQKMEATAFFKKYPLGVDYQEYPLDESYNKFKEKDQEALLKELKRKLLPIDIYNELSLYGKSVSDFVIYSWDRSIESDLLNYFVNSRKIKNPEDYGYSNRSLRLYYDSKTSKSPALKVYFTLAIRKKSKI